MSTFDVIASDIFLASHLNNLSLEMLPAGAVTLFGSDSLPDNWLLCNGQAVSRSTYSNLFASVGTLYGSGDGSTTFNLPNCQDKHVRCVSASYSLASTGGGSLTLASGNLPPHYHSISDDGSHGHGYEIVWSTTAGSTHHGLQISSRASPSRIFTDENTHSHGGATGTTGSGSTISVTVAYQVFNYMIKGY